MLQAILSLTVLSHAIICNPLVNQLILEAALFTF